MNILLLESFSLNYDTYFHYHNCSLMHINTSFDCIHQKRVFALLYWENKYSLLLKYLYDCSILSFLGSKARANRASIGWKIHFAFFFSSHFHPSHYFPCLLFAFSFSKKFPFLFLLPIHFFLTFHGLVHLSTFLHFN